MNEEARRNEITKAAVVYEIPGMDAVRIWRDVEYLQTEEGALTMDLYLPPESRRETPMPAVVFVSGFPDPGFEATLGFMLDVGGSTRVAPLVPFCP